MNKMKRLVSLLLCCVLLCALVPVFADNVKTVKLIVADYDRVRTFPYAGSPKITDVSSNDDTLIPLVRKNRVIIPANFVGYFCVRYDEADTTVNVYVCPDIVDLSVTAGIHEIHLNWTETEYADCYKVSVTLNGNTVYDKELDNDTTSLTVSDLKANTFYKVYVLAYSYTSVGSQAYSSVTTLEEPAKDPVNVKSFKVGKQFGNLDYSGRTMKLYVKTTQQLRIFGVQPKDAENPTFTYSSNNTKVATVSKKGLITAVKPGTATITVRAFDSTGKTCTAKISFKVKVLRPGE